MDPEVVRLRELLEWFKSDCTIDPPPQQEVAAALAALLADWERRGEALRGLLGAADDVLRGWDAKRQLSAGGTGMGHNILTEDAGRLTSIWYWEQVRKRVESARAALEEGKP